MKEKMKQSNNYTILIEGKKLYYLLCELMQKEISYQEQSKSLDKEYMDTAKIRELSFQDEESFSKCLDMIRTKKEQLGLQIYTLENGYYKPFVLTDPQNPYLQTSFLFQILSHPKAFLTSTVMAENFLKELQIEEDRKKEGKITGSYVSENYSPIQEKKTGYNKGKFLIEWENEQEDYVVRTEILNSSTDGKKKETPYHFLFQNVGTWNITEYYIRYKEHYRLHFSPDLDVVEIYAIHNGKMLPNPSKRILRSQYENVSSYEQEMIETISNYLLNQKIRKKARYIDKK